MDLQLKEKHELDNCLINKSIFEPDIVMKEESVETRGGWTSFIKELLNPHDDSVIDIKEESLSVQKDSTLEEKFSPHESIYCEDQNCLKDVSKEDSPIKKQKVNGGTSCSSTFKDKYTEDNEERKSFNTTHEGNPLPVINWMKQQGLLKGEIKCSSCAVTMNWTKCSSIKDQFVWKCQNKYCKIYKCNKSIRTGSIFSKSHIGLPKWMHIMYLWSTERSLENTSNQTSIGKAALVDVYKFLREICEQHFIRNPVQLGGPDVIVQIDVTCFSQRVRQYRGRDPQEPLSVLGIVDTSTNPLTGYMEIIDNRDTITLLPIINKVVRPGSIIHTDEWRSFKEIQNMDVTHKTVNHSVNFVEKTDVHTHIIESYWNKHKRMIRNMKGCRRELLNSYLNQMMWFDRFGTNAFLNLCEHIKDVICNVPKFIPSR